jgi:hypothetical protein
MNSPRYLLTAFLLLMVVLAHGSRAGSQSPDPGPQEDPVLGTSADFEETNEEGWVWLDAGEPLRRSPSAEAAPVTLVDVRVEVPVVERRDSWALVRYGPFKGWIQLRPEGEFVAEPTTAATTPDPQRLTLARELLGRDIEPERLGALELYTDVKNRRLLRFLEKVVERLPAAYRMRYGVDPGTVAREAVVIFSRERDYRAYLRTVSDGEIRPQGHTSRGLAVIFVGTQNREEVSAILVHELTHLLNRRALKTLPCPWLEEGMGNDLAYCRIAKSSGQLQLGSLGGRNVVIEHAFYFFGGESRTDREVRLEGPIASLSLLQKRLEQQEAGPLEVLLSLRWNEFTDTVDLRPRYDRSAFFVRYLLDSGDEDLADGFRTYLLSLANGGAAEPAALQASLGRSWDELEQGFEDWIRRQTVGGVSVGGVRRERRE